MTDVNGKPVPGSACVGVVDEAVFALAEQDVDMIGQLYKDVFYPSIYQHVSFHVYNLDRAFSDLGGRGGGGGAGGPLRKDFVDTALFQPVQVGDDGKAAVELTIPDNITAWRFTAAAITPDLKAGDQLIKVPSTLPFYIQPLFTSNYLAGDDVSVLLQGVGSALKTGDAVSYTVKITDETGGEIAAKDITGKVWEHTPVNFGKLKTGVYNLTVNAKTGTYSDAIQHPFSVIEQGLTVPMFQTVPLE